MKIFVDANERHYQKIKNPLLISLLSHSMTMSFTGFKFQLMTSFCLQISWMAFRNIAVFEL